PGKGSVSIRPPRFLIWSLTSATDGSLLCVFGPADEQPIAPASTARPSVGTKGPRHPMVTSPYAMSGKRGIRAILPGALGGGEGLSTETGHEAGQRAQGFYLLGATDAGPVDRRAQPFEVGVVELAVHAVGMAVLAAVREAVRSRVAAARRCVVDDLGD